MKGFGVILSMPNGTPTYTHHHCNHLDGANEMMADHEKMRSLLPQVESEFQSSAAMRGLAKGETLVAGYCRKTALVGAIGFEPMTSTV